MPHLSESLRYHRTRLGLSMTRLAHRAGINVGTISRWERGITRPCLPELEAVINEFRVPIEERNRLISLIQAPRSRRHLFSQVPELPIQTSIPIPSAGGYLRALRSRAGMSQAELASRLNTAQSTVVRWERGELWPGSDALSRLLETVGARPGEAEILKAHPHLLSPSSGLSSLSLDEAEALTDSLVSQMMLRVDPELTELRSHELLARLWTAHDRWQTRGAALLAYLMSRLGQWYLDLECGGAGMPLRGRVPEAIRYSRASLELAPETRGGLLSLLTLSRCLPNVGSRTRIQRINQLRAWSRKRCVTHPEWGANQISYAFASWALSEESFQLEQLGDLEGALGASLRAREVARDSSNPLEVRMRTSDHTERLIRIGRPHDALDFLETRSTNIEHLDLWRRTQTAEVYAHTGRRGLASCGLETMISDAQRLKMLGLENRLRALTRLL